MNLADWARIRDAFHEIAAAPAAERAARLDALRRDDPDIADEVRRMLDASPTRLAPGDVVALDALADELEDVPDPPAIEIDRYELLERIGVGGMGEVHRARRADGAYERDVAIKVARLGLTAPGLQRRLRAERAMLARLQHPNIASLIDGGVASDGRPYIIMEYVSGDPIDRWCDERALSIRARVELFDQVCGAVGHAHRNLVIHRDLKPSNVLVTPEGRVKLLDFGVATVLEPDREATRTGARMLTPRYASPEQIAGEVVSTASDVYSLGVILYELLTGRGAYRLEDPTPAAYQVAIREQTPTAPSDAITRPTAGDDGLDAGGLARRRGAEPAALRRALRGDLDTIILKALRKEPERRYETVEQLRADLQAWRRGLPVSARPDSVRYRAGKFARRHPFAIAAGVLAAGSLMTSSLVGFTLYSNEQDARTLADQRLEQANRSRATLEAVNDFFTNDVILAADPDRAQNADRTIVEALQAAEQSIDGRFPEAPLVEASVRASLGAVYNELSRMAEARPHLQRAHELRVEHLGENHFDTLITLRDYANTFFYLDEYAEAATIYEDLVPRFAKIAGPEDGYTVLARSQYAQILEALGRYEESEREHRDVLDIRLRQLGEEHGSTLSSINNLGVLLARRGRIDEALVYLEKAADLRAKRNGPDSPRTLIARGNVAAMHMMQGRTEIARPIFRDVLDRQLRTIGPGHRHTMRTVVHLTNTCELMGDPEAAERIARETLEAADAGFDDDRPWIFDGYERLVLALLAREKFEEAAPICDALLEFRQARFGTDHPQTAAARSLVERARTRASEG